jgi:hypothetical protein
MSSPPLSPCSWQSYGLSGVFSGGASGPHIYIFLLTSLIAICNIIFVNRNPLVPGRNPSMRSKEANALIRQSLGLPQIEER